MKLLVVRFYKFSITRINSHKIEKQDKIFRNMKIRKVKSNFLNFKRKTRVFMRYEIEEFFRICRNQMRSIREYGDSERIKFLWAI